MTRHLLVTNDFPPKVGGIQTYLWELWRRLPAEDVTVVTTGYEGDSEFDAGLPFRVERWGGVLLPTRSLVRNLRGLAREVGAEVVVLDPGVPVGLVGPSLGLPYVVVMHGSELAGRVPGGARALGWVLSQAAHVIAAGNYPATETVRLAGATPPPVTVVPPGVDVRRFRPLTPEQRGEARRDFGVEDDRCVVVGMSRLVPRKGFDVLIRAAGRLARRDVTLLIGGDGWDRARLQRIAATGAADVRFAGRVPDGDLPRMLGCADVFAMICRDRWAGLEREGFGMVFMEAAACGVPQLAGDSGGAADAVADGETGIVVPQPREIDDVASALRRLIDDPVLRAHMGKAARARAEDDFDHGFLAARVAHVLDTAAGRA